MVAHIITRLAMGGAQQLVFEITKRMKDSSKDVVIFTGESNKNSLSAQDNNILKEVYKNNIRVELVSSLTDKISLFHDLIAMYSICKLLKKYDPSIIHIHSSKTGILGRLACKLMNKKNVIYHIHGWSFSRFEGIKKRFYFNLEKVFYHLTTKYIFVCKQDMDDYIDLGGSSEIKHKSNVIYPGVDFLEEKEQNKSRLALRKKLGYSESDHIIGSIGRIDYQKNPQIFVKIAYYYSKIDSKAKFLWVGKGKEKDKLEILIEELGLNEKFIFTGYVEDAEPYFSIFDTFILSSRYEGLPLTILKALSSRTPVVAFLVNGINDLSIKFKILYGVPCFNTDQFVRGLIESKKIKLNNKKLINAEAKYVRKNFDLNKMYDNINEIYNSLK